MLTESDQAPGRRSIQDGSGALRAAWVSALSDASSREGVHQQLG